MFKGYVAIVYCMTKYEDDGEIIIETTIAQKNNFT